jgi:hypothetical protein
MTLTTRRYYETNKQGIYLGRTPVTEVTLELNTGAGAGAGAGEGTGTGTTGTNVAVRAGGGAGAGAVETGAMGTTGAMVTVTTAVLSQGVGYHFPALATIAFAAIAKRTFREKCIAMGND